MFELSNIKITKSKVDERSIESNGFWFTPINDEFNVDGVVEFITNELESPKWLDGKTFSSLNHLFVTESQTNLFMALCPFVSIDGYSFELKYNRILGGHQIYVTKEGTEDVESEEAGAQTEETEAEPKVEEKQEATEEDSTEEKTEDTTEVEEKAEEKVEEPKEKKTTARKSTKK